MQVFSPLSPVNCWKKSLSTRSISDLKQKWQITSQYHSLLCAVYPQNQGAFIHCIRCVLWYSVLFYSASPLALKLNAVFVWIQNDLRSSRKVRKWQYPNMKVWLISRLSALYSHSCTGEKQRKFETGTTVYIIVKGTFLFPLAEFLLMNTTKRVWPVWKGLPME